jgi:hypothetical protein
METAVEVGEPVFKVAVPSRRRRVLLLTGVGVEAAPPVRLAVGAEQRGANERQQRAAQLRFVEVQALFSSAGTTARPAQA